MSAIPSDEPLFSSSPDDEPSPPAVTPPLSPPTPTSPEPTLSSLLIDIYRMQDQLEVLEKIVTEPQIISLVGIQELNIELGHTWKDKLHTLLFQAHVPHFWIVKVVPDEDNQDYPNIVYLYCLNHHVKDKIKDSLRQFLELYYNNVYLL